MYSNWRTSCRGYPSTVGSVLSRLPGSRKAAGDQSAVVPDPAVPDSGTSDDPTLEFSVPQGSGRTIPDHAGSDQVGFGRATRDRLAWRRRGLHRATRDEGDDGGDAGRSVRPVGTSWVRRAGARGAARAIAVRAWYREREWLPGWAFTAG